MSTISVTVEKSVYVDVDVDIDIDEVLEEISSEDLIQELRNRGALPDNPAELFQQLDYKMLMEELMPIFGMLRPDEWREMINEYRERHHKTRLPQMQILSA